jgi:hypothetical protein
VKCTLGTLAKGGTASVTIDAQPVGTTLDLNFSATSGNADLNADLNASNNSVSLLAAAASEPVSDAPLP